MRSMHGPNHDPAQGAGLHAFARRLFSLSGVVPLGAFLVVHLAVNTRALQSEAAFDKAMAAIHRLPALALLEWLFVFAPLLLHAAVGLWLVATNRPLAEQSPYPRTVRIAVRVTGVAAIAFLALHLPELRFRAPGVRLGGAELATVLAADLSSTSYGMPWRGAVYLVGAACVTFHFVAGVWAFLVTTRVGDKEKARAWAGWGALALGAAIWVALANVVVFHATGARLFGSPLQDVDPSSGRCPSGK